MGSMKKKKVKTKTKTKPKKQKIDVVLESLLNLETVVRELVKKVEQLQYFQPYHSPEKPNPPKYWPVDYPKYKDVTWDAINNGWQ
jgi:hypothetical protein